MTHPRQRFRLIDRRAVLQNATATAAALALPRSVRTQQSDLAPIYAQIAQRHDEAVQRLQTWMRQPSIAAEHRGMNEGCDLTIGMLRDAGFQHVTKVSSDGQPGIFATLDAGAPKTLGLYFMYDVKQVDPAEWSSPPWDAALVDKAGLGKVVMGRGAVNQKGPEATFLAALHAIATLVSPDGNDPAIDNFAAKARPLAPDDKAMIAAAAARLDETAAKQQLGVQRWAHDASWTEALEMLMSRPTVNIEGLVGGYTGPGGKTILPHRAVAKLDLRLVPDMTAADALAALKAHLAQRGFGDIEVNMTGGYDPTSTARDAMVIRAQEAVYRRSRIEPILLPRDRKSTRLNSSHLGISYAVF